MCVEKNNKTRNKINYIFLFISFLCLPYFRAQILSRSLFFKMVAQINLLPSMACNGNSFPSLTLHYNLVSHLTVISSSLLLILQQQLGTAPPLQWCSSSLHTFTWWQCYVASRSSYHIDLLVWTKLVWWLVSVCNGSPLHTSVGFLRCLFFLKQLNSHFYVKPGIVQTLVAIVQSICNTQSLI